MLPGMDRPPARERGRVEVVDRRKQSGRKKLPGLKSARLKAMLTQKQLAEKAGVQQATVSRLEWEDHAAQLRTHKKLADALGVKPEELTKEPEEPDVA